MIKINTTKTATTSTTTILAIIAIVDRYIHKIQKRGMKEHNTRHERKDRRE